MKYIDPILLVEVEHQRVHANLLAEELKSTLIRKGINWASYNSNKDSPPMEVPLETYGYQNFYILRDGNDSLLLDGFRRLLWWDAPAIEVNVFYFQKETLSDSDLMKLMLMLNQQKLYSIQDFYDRGFALFMKTHFDLNILDYSKAFYGYLSMNENRMSSSNSIPRSNTSEVSIKNRLLSSHLVSDMRFIQEISIEKEFKNNYYLGSLVYWMRKSYDGDFSATDFNKSHLYPKTLEVLSKIKQSFSDERDKKNYNCFLELCESIMLSQKGIEPELTFEEEQELAKKESLRLKKLGYTNLTGKPDEELENLFFKSIETQPLDMKAVVFPVKKETYSYNNTVYLKAGTYDCGFEGFLEKTRGYSGKVKEPILTLKNTTHKYRVESQKKSESFSMYWNYVNKYNSIFGEKTDYASIGYLKSHKIHFFVKL